MKYVFDTDRLHELSKSGVGLPFDQMVSTVVEQLDRAYPGQINTEVDWVMTMAAGFKGSMTVLHASLSEYLIIFGTPITTAGFSGKWKLEIHDFMLDGEMWSYDENHPGTRVESRAGDHIVLEKGQGKGVSIADGAWMLEYARGPIATALPLGVGDALFSCGDLSGVRKTFKIYQRLTIKALRNRRKR